MGGAVGQRRVEKGSRMGGAVMQREAVGQGGALGHGRAIGHERAVG